MFNMMNMQKNMPIHYVNYNRGMSVEDLELIKSNFNRATKVK